MYTVRKARDYNKFPIRTESDYVKALHAVFSLMDDSIQSTRKNQIVRLVEEDYIIQRIFDELNDESTLYYDGKLLDFEEFVHAVAKDTKPGLFSKLLRQQAKIKKYSQVKTILIKLVVALQNMIDKKAVPKGVDRFIKKEYGYDISNKDTINLLNFLVNYKFYHDLNLHAFLEAVYPELIEDKSIVWKTIPDPPDIIDSPSKKEEGKRFGDRPLKPRNAPAGNAKPAANAKPATNAKPAAARSRSTRKNRKSSA